MTTNSTKNTAAFTLRMSKELKERLQLAAEFNGHSLNTEILMRLTKAGIEDQHALIMKESGEIKAMLRELLDRD